MSCPRWRPALASDLQPWCTPVGDSGLLDVSRVATLEHLECYRIGASRAGMDAPSARPGPT
ncbi:MAG: hypothetical protein U0800_16820 [Isosphaeraceae bacterium]